MKGLAELYLSDKHQKAIGLVAAQWSYTELFLEYLIWAVLGINDHQGAAITTHIPSETRIYILETLASIQLPNETHKKELKSIVSKLRLLRTERNNIVHALWSSPSTSKSTSIQKRKPTPASRKIKAKGELNVQSNPMTAKQIMAVADQIGELAHSMFSLQEKIAQARTNRGLIAQAMLEGSPLFQSLGPTPKVIGPLSALLPKSSPT